MSFETHHWAWNTVQALYRDFQAPDSPVVVSQHSPHSPCSSTLVFLRLFKITAISAVGLLLGGAPFARLSCCTGGSVLSCRPRLLREPSQGSSKCLLKFSLPAPLTQHPFCLLINTDHSLSLFFSLTGLGVATKDECAGAATKRSLINVS